MYIICCVVIIIDLLYIFYGACFIHELGHGLHLFISKGNHIYLRFKFGDGSLLSGFTFSRTYLDWVKTKNLHKIRTNAYCGFLSELIVCVLLIIFHISFKDCFLFCVAICFGVVYIVARVLPFVGGYKTKSDLHFVVHPEEYDYIQCIKNFCKE